MVTTRIQPPPEDTRTESERLRDQGRILGGAERILGGEPKTARPRNISPVGREAILSRLSHTRAEIAAMKRRVEVACEEIALATETKKKLEECERDLLRDVEHAHEYDFTPQGSGGKGYPGNDEA